MAGAFSCGGSQHATGSNTVPLDHGSPIWSLTTGGTGSASAADVAVTPTGEIAVLGSFDQTITLGDITLTSAGARDGFLALLEPDGRPRWAQRFGGPGIDAGSALAIAPDGTLLIAGQLEGTGDFNGTPMTTQGSPGGFVAAISATAPKITVLEGDSFVVVTDLAAGPDGEAYVTGYFSGNLRVGGQVTTSSRGDHDAYAMRLVPGESQLNWIHTFGGAGADLGRGIALTSTGELALVGSIAGDQSTPLFPIEDQQERNPTPDGFVARLDTADGSPHWSMRVAGNGYDLLHAVAALPDEGGLIVTGTFFAPILLGTTPLEPTAGMNSFVARISAAGAVQWATVVGGRGTASVRGLSVAPGSVFLAGDLAGTVSLGTEHTAESVGHQDGFAAVMNLDGQARWLRSFGGSEQDDLAGIAAPADGGAILVGSFSGQLQLGATGHTATGARAVYVVRVAN